MASPSGGDDFESSLLSFEKLDRASPDLWPEQLPGVAEFAASFKSPITNPPLSGWLNWKTMTSKC
uniref:Protein lin-52 homolog n=1 Tax=Anguilla anguilla TaxID=7936 RepID=A0A0E9WPU1_ANGAN